MAKRKTLEECKQLIEDRGGKLIKLNEEYRGLSTKADIKCSECDNAITTTIGGYLKRKYTICGDCMKKHNEEKENNNNNNDMIMGIGLSLGGMFEFVSDKHNRSKDYTQKDWSKEVKERDNNICQCCGYKKEDNENMYAHHLDGYDWCKDKRSDIDNGVCLCEECHKKFHNIFGLGNNTKEEYEYYKSHKLYKNNKLILGRTKKDIKRLKDEAEDKVFNSYTVRSI